MAQDLRQESWISRGWKRRPEVFCAFFGALIFGLIAQGMGMLNKFSWHDDIHSLFLTGATITSGRWMLHVLGAAEVFLFGDGHFSLPLINGLCALLCIAAAGGLIVWMLKIRSRVLSALLGCMMASFPMVTALLGFMFTAHYYMLAMLMMVTCAALLCRGSSWRAKVFGVMLGACSVGIYQAFLPLLISLILLCDLVDLAEGEETFPAFLRRLGIQVICAVGVMIVYTACSRLFLHLYDLEMDSYMGLSEVGSVPLAEYFQRAMQAYREYFFPTRNVIWDMYPQHVRYLYLLSLVINVVLSILLILQTWRQSRGKAGMMAVLLVVFPLGCNLIFVLSEEVHSLMVYGQVAHFALLCMLADRVLPSHSGWRRVISGAVAGVLAVISCMYARYDNQCYLKIAFQQQEIISWNTSLIAQIKSSPGYRDELPVAFVGRRNVRDGSLYNMEELNWLTISGYNTDIQENVNSWAWTNYMQRWCGYGPWEADAEEAANLPEVQAMPCYPEEGSIRIVDEMIVVKFAQAEEEEADLI